MIKLSIITVNLNNLPGLQKTVESVASQTYYDFEYILIDGFSVDGSQKMIRQFSISTNLNLKWISEPDLGVYEAMNKGTRLAKGEYLLFLNSGDFLVNRKVLEDVFSVPHTADFLLGRCNISENEKVIHTTNPPEKITFGYLYTSNLAHQSTFIRREMFIKYGYYREDFQYNADIEFWYRTIIMQCCSTESLPIITTDYNKHGISSKEKQSGIYQKEISEIYSHPFLQLFIPDYDAWIKERQENQVLYWVQSKKHVYALLQSVYRFARWFAKIRK